MSMANYGKLWFDGTLQETWQLHVSTIDFDPYPFMAFQLDTEYQILHNGEHLNKVTSRPQCNKEGFFSTYAGNDKGQHPHFGRGIFIPFLLSCLRFQRRARYASANAGAGSAQTIYFILVEKTHSAYTHMHIQLQPLPGPANVTQHRTRALVLCSSEISAFSAGPIYCPTPSVQLDA